MSGSFIREANAWAADHEIVVARFWNMFNDEQKVRIWRATVDEGIEVPDDAAATLAGNGFNVDDVDMTYRAVLTAAYIQSPYTVDAIQAITDFNQALRQAGMPVPLAPGSKAPNQPDEFGFGDWNLPVQDEPPIMNPDEPQIMLPAEYFSPAAPISPVGQVPPSPFVPMDAPRRAAPMSEDFFRRNNLSMPTWVKRNGVWYADQQYAVTPQTGRIILVGDRMVRETHRTNSSYLAFLHKDMPQGPAFLLPAGSDWLGTENTEVMILHTEQVPDQELYSGFLSRNAEYNFDLHIERNGEDDLIVRDYNPSDAIYLSESSYPFRFVQSGDFTFPVLLRVESWPLVYHEQFKTWLHGKRYEYRNGAFHPQDWTYIDPAAVQMQTASQRKIAGCLKTNVRFASFYVRSQPRNQAGQVIHGSIVYLDSVGIVLKPAGSSNLSRTYMVPPDDRQYRWMQYRIPPAAFPADDAERIPDERVEFAWRNGNQDYNFIDGQRVSPNRLRGYHRSVHNFMVGNVTMPDNSMRYFYVTPRTSGRDVYHLTRDIMVFAYDEAFQEFYFREQRLMRVQEQHQAAIEAVVPRNHGPTPMRQDLSHARRGPPDMINGRRVPEGRYYCPDKMPDKVTAEDQDRWRIRPNGEIFYDKKRRETATTQPLRTTADSRWKCYKAGYNASHGNSQWKASRLLRRGQ